MSQIKLTLSGQVLSLSQATIVGDSLNFITAEIVKKSSTWDGLTLWLSISKGNANYIVAFEEDILTEHLNLASGSYSVSVYGELTANGNVVKRVTSSVTSLTVQPSGVIDGEPLPVTPPSVGEQILAVAQNALSVANGVRADADAGEFDGEGVPTGGTTGQILAKHSDTDYDTEWIDPPDTHEETLTEHGNAIESLDDTVAEHGETIAALVEFSENIASANDVEEVLEDA